MKKNRLFLFLTILMMIWFVAGCGGADAGDSISGKTTIVCTNFPLYDWTRTLLAGSETEVILLLDNGTDMHSFQPSAEELIQIAECDVLVHVGGESDLWLEEALDANPNEDRIVVNLMDVLEDELKEETHVEGMQTEHEHEHEEKNTMDEHIWLSLRLAAKACEAIEDAVCLTLPEEAEQIRANGEQYRGELVALEQKYEDMITESGEQGIILVADRFPFLYMMEDYGIEYYAAFPGCSTESEADFETVVFLAEKVTENDLDVLFITESGTDVLAQTISENAGKKDVEIVTLHSMQVVYQSDIESGCSYIGYMEENLEALRSAF